MALTEARTNLANGFKFNNFVAGKGRGLVVLLQYSSQNSHLSACLYTLAAL